MASERLEIVPEAPPGSPLVLPPVQGVQPGEAEVGHEPLETGSRQGRMRSSSYISQFRMVYYCFESLNVYTAQLTRGLKPLGPPSF